MKSREIFLRFVLGAVVGGIVTAGYRFIQHLTVASAVVRHSSWTWSHLPFAPLWLWPYASMLLLLGLPWFLLPTLADARRFAAVLVGIASVGWCGFLLYPTACARPELAGGPFAYRLLIELDKPNNCLPCLHSAFAVLAVGALLRDNVKVQQPLVASGLIVWLLTICVSIVALRQHTDEDMLAGVVLGLLGIVAYVRRPT